MSTQAVRIVRRQPCVRAPEGAYVVVDDRRDIGGRIVAQVPTEAEAQHIAAAIEADEHEHICECGAVEVCTVALCTRAREATCASCINSESAA